MCLSQSDQESEIFIVINDDRERVADAHGMDETGMIRAVIAPQNDSYDNGIHCSSRTRVQHYYTS